ncbi:putative RNA-directed DNA polymerase from transposon BS [Dictyocoela muelleri]|nr:putative RNA-directed DNA polymerase from transposon BS [Dictyocoela muelleri]
MTVKNLSTKRSRNMHIEYVNIIRILRCGRKMLKVRNKYLGKYDTDLLKKSLKNIYTIQNNNFRTDEININKKKQKFDPNLIDLKNVDSWTDTQNKNKNQMMSSKRISYNGNPIKEIDELIERNITAKTYKEKFIYNNFGKIKCVDLKELKDIIKSLSNNISGGKSDIRYELLKLIDDQIIMRLCDFFNICIYKRRIPDDWKKFQIIPIRKNRNMFRIISISETLRKIYEKVILKRLNINISDNQIGFKPGNRREDHLLVLDTYLRRSNGNAKIITLDVQNAYDSVDRQIVYSKLVNEHKVSGKLMQVLYSLFESNLFVIKKNNFYCLEYPMNIGLPQGYILSPILFNIFLDDIVYSEKFPFGCKVLLYADDILIMADNITKCQIMLDIFFLHSIRNKYIINYKKSYFLSKDSDDLFINGEQITKVDKIKYLGHYFNLKSADINISIKKCTKNVMLNTNVISRFLKNKPGNLQKPSLRLELYKKYVSPHIDNYLILLASRKTAIEKLEIIQRRSLKKIFCVSFKTSSDLLYALIPVLPIYERSRILSRKYFDSLEISSSRKIVKQIFEEKKTSLLLLIENSKNYHFDILNYKKITDHIRNTRSNIIISRVNFNKIDKFT